MLGMWLGGLLIGIGIGKRLYKNKSSKGEKL